jgi:hypothetical protein
MGWWKYDCRVGNDQPIGVRGTFLDPGDLVISLGPLTSGQGIGEVLPQHGACLCRILRVLWCMGGVLHGFFGLCVGSGRWPWCLRMSQKDWRI